jgi:hypothetical protein
MTGVFTKGMQLVVEILGGNTCIFERSSFLAFENT